MATRADWGRTLARSHGDFDALLVGSKMGVLVDKTPEGWQRFKIVISSIVRGGAGETSTIIRSEAQFAFTPPISRAPSGDRQGS
jgi:hypothetical protein